MRVCLRFFSFRSVPSCRYLCLTVPVRDLVSIILSQEAGSWDACSATTQGEVPPPSICNLRVYAFETTPVAPVHVLGIHKIHTRTSTSGPVQRLASWRSFLAVKEVARIKGIDAEGNKVIINNERPRPGTSGISRPRARRRPDMAPAFGLSLPLRCLIVRRPPAPRVRRSSFPPTCGRLFDQKSMAPERQAFSLFGIFPISVITKPAESRAPFLDRTRTASEKIYFQVAAEQYLCLPAALISGRPDARGSCISPTISSAMSSRVTSPSTAPNSFTDKNHRRVIPASRERLVYLFGRGNEVRLPQTPGRSIAPSSP